MQRTLSKSEVAVIEKKYDLLELKITALPNKKLSEVRQDSQSFRFGYATLAGSFLDRAATHRALQTELEALFLDS